MLLIIQRKSFEFSPLLTEEMLMELKKQHSSLKQFLRIPLSPLEASSRLPRSRDHIFSHSMSKALLPQGPDM